MKKIKGKTNCICIVDFPYFGMKETGSEKERAVFEAAVESWVRSHLNSQSSAVCIPSFALPCCPPELPLTLASLLCRSLGEAGRKWTGSPSLAAHWPLGFSLPHLETCGVSDWAACKYGMQVSVLASTESS